MRPYTLPCAPPLFTEHVPVAHAELTRLISPAPRLRLTCCHPLAVFYLRDIVFDEEASCGSTDLLLQVVVMIIYTTMVWSDGALPAVACHAVYNDAASLLRPKQVFSCSHCMGLP